MAILDINQEATCIFVILSCAFLATVYVTLLPPHLRCSFSGRCYTMPPGPRGLPILGNLPEWLRARNGGSMGNWLKRQSQYGEWTTLSMGTKTWVLLNTSRVVNEIIAKRAGITHERPHFPIAGGLVSKNKRLFLQKTSNWGEGRRLIQQLMMGLGSKNHDHLAEVASLGFLRAYLDEPQEWYAHNYRYPVSVIYSIVTNSPLKKSTEDLAELQRTTSTFLTSINSSPVDFFPQLSHIPKFLQFWRPHWENMGTFHYTVFKKWWAEILSLDSPDLRPSFVFDSVFKEFSGTTEQAMYLTMFVISAGADNPRMTINAGIMACIAYSAAMDKARHELDKVCGENANRLPSLEDLPKLPYVCAVVKEILRWRPTVPLIPQRVLTKDMELEGYRFPAGTEFLVNSIAVCNNGYERPEEFSPERWLDAEKPGGGVEQTLWQYAFSAGKRSCVGYKLAQKEMFLVFARLLYCFDFVPAGDFDDKKLNAFEPGEPFPVRVTVRSPAHERLIRDEAVVCDMWDSQ